MTEFQIRLAKISDVEPILNFCLHTWENQKDYMSLVLDKRISDPKGKIYVATFDDIPVAMEQLVILSKQEAWRDSLRVDPHYRRMRKLAYSLGNVVVRGVFSLNNIFGNCLSQAGFQRIKQAEAGIYECQVINKQLGI